MTTRRSFFDAAMHVLASRGFTGLTIAGLCEAVGVTSGSFYHHFGSWAGFVDSLMLHWEEEHSARILATARAEHDPLARIEVMAKLAKERPHAAEAAIRSWSGNDASVAAVQARVDHERGTFVADAFAQLFDEAEARTLARVAHASFVGLQQLAGRMSPVELEEAIDAVASLIVSRASDS